MADIGADYEFKIDFGRDETFAHDLADVTARCLNGWQWNLGMQDSYQEVAPPSRLAVDLKDEDRMLHPSNSASPYYGLLKRGVLVRLRASYGVDWHTLWIGKITTVTPSVGQRGDLIVRLLCDDPMLALNDAEFKPELMESVTADVAIAPIFDEGLVPHPYPHRYWLLGVVGSSELDVSTRLYENTVTDFDTGSKTFAFTGDIDDGDVGQTAQGFIRRYVAAEPGRFFYDARVGKFKFHSRHRDVNNLTSQITLTATDMPLDRLPPVSFGEDVVNAITLNYIPREIGSAGTVIYSAANLPRRVREHDSVTFTARYQDVTEKHARVGAKDVIPPLVDIDFVAEFVDDEARATGDVNVAVQAGGTSAEITLVNNTDRDVDFTTLQLRGTPIVTYEQATVDEVDTASMFEYGRIERTLSLPAIDDEDDARQFVGYILGRFKQATVRLPSMSFYANRREETMIGALSLSVGDRITVQDAWSEHDQDYFIVGESHVVQLSGAPGKHLHLVTWVLAPTARQKFWLLGVEGYSELDFNTTLAY